MLQTYLEQNYFISPMFLTFLLNVVTCAHEQRVKIKHTLIINIAYIFDYPVSYRIDRISVFDH